METQTKVVAVQLADGSAMKVRATMLGGYEDVGAFDKLLSFDEVTQTIERLGGALVKTWEKVKPHKASVEFGLEIGVESGTLTTLLASTTGSANLKISLEWEREKPKSG